jgi:NAD(P)-dependent dehydrogenase (short-subunit alcohol dehydrogenase family)
MALARRKATVVLACRDPKRAVRAVDQIHVAVPEAEVRVVRLDLASLSSVRDTAAELRTTCPHIDLLINNAGVMQVPSHRRSQDGFELTFATNHLGHFGLTGLLLDRLLATPGSRIVTVSSLAHRRGLIDFDDLGMERNYTPGGAYDRSKLANLLFTYELEQRLLAMGAGTIALAAHPGIVSTDLWRTSSRAERLLTDRHLRMLNFWLVQSPARGALPILRTALDPSAQAGDYFGPGGWGQFTGDPVRVESTPLSHDETVRRWLWEASEDLTGVSFAGEAG